MTKLLHEQPIQTKYASAADRQSVPWIANGDSFQRKFLSVLLSIVTGLLCGLLIIQVVNAPYAVGLAVLAGFGVMSSMIMFSLAD